LVGTDKVKIDGRLRHLTLPSGDPFQVWTITATGESDFLGMGWSSTLNEGILARFVLEWSGSSVTVKCSEVLLEGRGLSGTTIIHTLGNFPGLVVLFDQARSRLLYWNIGAGEPRVVLTTEDHPELYEMNYFFLLSGTNHENPQLDLLGVYFQPEVKSASPAKMDFVPSGVLMDDCGDGVFEQIAFYGCEGSSVSN
jgi:hypothetical protein